MADNLSDKALIEKILARDRRSLGYFYTRYTPKLTSYIRAKIHNPADCEEILQDTLFAFLEGLRDFQGNSSISTFLYAICHNKIIDFYRKKKLKQLVFSQMPNLETLISSQKNPEEELDIVLLKEKIQSVLSKILPHYRSLLVSKYIENLSVSDIAGKFALSMKGAESQLFRARKAFVEKFVSI